MKQVFVLVLFGGLVVSTGLVKADNLSMSENPAISADTSETDIPFEECDREAEPDPAYCVASPYGGCKHGGHSGATKSEALQRCRLFHPVPCYVRCY
ncbi:MAG: hypothetical protein HY537_16500 [Deltaproteobacteria bacterium]|nr:hypothetical protein [Deltaproteobacteria bacterium]